MKVEEWLAAQEKDAAFGLEHDYLTNSLDTDDFALLVKLARLAVEARGLLDDFGGTGEEDEVFQWLAKYDALVKEKE